ncbi:hypothetical protein HNY73_013499 [Argiope bruennichi]|uniref:Uncharacterized protein n=1 Tax=Argiope bruennichi TaxID=94029 RepID=A0A8T0F487_ARGBR|nr:hypothetical protein HNY73_013499 [Argiope bruennichi]
MSVICQNFVQNAWKKDLCSNCFKSVGDHEMSENASNDQVKNQNEKSTIRYVSQASTTSSTVSNSTPHTTWKTLISERNTKNSQPFKLETGFQGRLLTINKSYHGSEKNSVNGSSKNGHASDSELLSDNESKRNVNGRITKTDFTQIRNKCQSLNGFSLSNGNDHVEAKIDQNGTNNKNEKGAKLQNEHEGTKNTVSSRDSKLMKSKSEDTLFVPLHSILKKTVSTPTNQKQTRRGSNVGFANEEPLVIGYGGRDFTPEELEWDMNTSDGENGLDSLDETEDDKAFSKMTKLNTEFNADNTNLIQTVSSISEGNGKETHRSEKNTKQKENGQKPSQVAITNKEGSVETTNAVKSIQPTELTVTDGTDAIEKNKSTNEKNRSINEDKSSLHNGFQLAEMDIKDSELNTQKPSKDQKDSINVSIKGDKGAQIVSSGEVTVVETAKVGEAKAEVKNNRVNDALPPSCVISTPNLSGSGCERQGNPVMFSDGEERTGETTNPLPDENNEWQGGGEMAGQILQAINTSLANRHKMKDDQEVQSNNKEDPADDSSESTYDSKCHEHLSTDGTDDAENTSDASAERPVSSDEELIQNNINVEPRKSFLHGLTSKKSAKPSAIYGPASDLFVSRSNSSSSSSSDEFNKSEASHSINVIINGEKNGKENANTTESENEDLASHHSYLNEQESNCSVKIKAKPKIPAKPAKQPVRPTIKQTTNEYSKPKLMKTDPKDSDSTAQNDLHYAEANSNSYEDNSNISLVGHYAESNIYHEVDNSEMKIQEDEQSERVVPRESKLAALAMELEQARHCNNNTKRQAPAPPKIPDPPTEDPPNSIGRASPTMSDNSHSFASYRGDVMAFSSASSTASTSSQDTETGYASWNLHGDLDDHRKQSKSKSSFLLTQYSKCKMLAMGYAEDSARSRKKFSIKKLLKIKKENDSSAFDPNCPNPKAWKYSENFEKPRAKLEIIHPMDLENKSVTVNPGFDSMHSGSMSSFSASADDLSLRNSVSSDYGSFYSDTISPMQDLKSEVNYESIPPQLPLTEEQEDADERQATGSSNSPTPSRSSCVSQASTLTSGSSKNGGASPHRPPKPPPPPRAHSLLPGNKSLNPDGTYKFPVLSCNAISNVEIPVSPTKPQAPKRQFKASTVRSDCGIYDNTGLVPTPEETEALNESLSSVNDKVSMDGNTYGTILDIKSNNSGNHNSVSVGVIVSSESSTSVERKEEIENKLPIYESKMDTQSINVTVTTVSEPLKKTNKPILARNKHSPLTKAPARPPPIYMKSQINNIVKNPNPWKTLEDSYLVLTASNRELLVKLINQALKKRKDFLTTLHKIKFQWAEFEIDVEQPSSVFAFGEKIAYHATMPKHPEYPVTLVVTVQQQHSRLNENNEMKYPVFGQFVDYIPKELLENSNDAELESMQATILVLDRSNILTIECFTENLPISLTEENEKELCFIILQLIHSLKSLQAQGTESIDSSFQNLILAKTKQDKYNTLVFLYDNCYDEHDYMSDSCKISLCQYALMLLFQMLNIQSVEEFMLISATKFSSEISQKVFKAAIYLLSEEKAVSLSQTKTLLECFLWEVTKVMESLEDSDDIESILHRWLDIKRANYIKNIFDDDSSCDINVQSEYYSQFLLRTSIRNIKEVLSYL